MEKKGKIHIVMYYFYPKFVPHRYCLLPGYEKVTIWLVQQAAERQVSV